MSKRERDLTVDTGYYSAIPHKKPASLPLPPLARPNLPTQPICHFCKLLMVPPAGTPSPFQLVATCRQCSIQYHNSQNCAGIFAFTQTCPECLTKTVIPDPLLTFPQDPGLYPAAVLHSKSWKDCTEISCDYRTRRSDHMQQHRSMVHDIDVVWQFCKEDGCDAKVKTKGELSVHESKVHNIGVKWNFCLEMDCKVSSVYSGQRGFDGPGTEGNSTEGNSTSVTQSGACQCRGFLKRERVSQSSLSAQRSQPAHRDVVSNVERIAD